DTDDHVLAVDRGHDRNTKVDLAPSNHDSEAAVLRNAAFGDVQLRHDLDALNDCLMMSDVDGIGRAIERAVDSVLDDDVRVASFNVNIRCASLESVEHDGVNQLDDRRHLVVARAGQPL